MMLYGRDMSPTDTKLVNFRLTKAHRDDLAELQEHLGGATTIDVHVMAVRHLRESLGIARMHGVELVEAIIRDAGDDAQVVATVTDWKHGKGALTIDGKAAADFAVHVAPMFTGPAEDVGTLPAAAIIAAVHRPTKTTFDFGRLADVQDGDTVTVRAGDLPDHIVLSDPDRSKSAKALTDEFRMAVRLRRALHDAGHDLGDDE
jgi:hypothetical protein